MLPDTCDIQVRRIVPDGMGGSTETWVTYLFRDEFDNDNYGAEDVACLLAPLTSKNQGQAGNQFMMHGGWVLSVAFDRAIASGNRVVMGGDTYEVLGVEDDHSTRILRRADLHRLD